MQQKPRLISFDLDGTLVHRSTTCLELAKAHDCLDEVMALEAGYTCGEITHREFAERNAAVYRDWPLEDAERAALALPLIDGLSDTVRTLKASGPHILIVTVTWSFVALALVRSFGLDGFAGATMGERDGRLTGEVTTHFGEVDKPRYVEAYGREHGIGLSQCVAIGDSRSDLPLFAAVGHAIALNATNDAREAAHTTVDTDDLRDVLPHIGFEPAA